MTRLRREILIGLTFFIAGIAGCSQTKPPLAEVSDAAQRVESARADGASTYAPQELRVAQDRLGQTRTAMRSEEYEQAMQLADETQVAGDLARAKTRLGKVREKVDARQRENEQLRGDLTIGGDANQGGAQP
jgi:outer membrane murein-binding lipoprotein Lpp